MSKKIFAELNGFVIYEPTSLARYLEERGLAGGDVLKLFTQTEHGDVALKEGIAVPITGVEADYYGFAVDTGEAGEIFKPNAAKIVSKGWVFRSEGELKVVGIGYLSDMSRIGERNSLSFSVKKGWYNLEIRGGYEHGEPVFRLVLSACAVKPEFSADLDAEFYF